MRRRRSESGQAVIEFVLSLIFLMGFVVFIVHLSMSFAAGNYIHYATFMGARTLLPADMAADVQRSSAESVMRTMLSSSSGGTRFAAWISPGQSGNTTQVPGARIVTDAGQQSQNENSRYQSWIAGVMYEFNTKIFMGPLSGSVTGSNLTLTSESWLGREESFMECLNRMVSIQGNEVYLDNGC